MIDSLDAAEGVPHPLLCDMLMRPVRSAPTLVKYAEANGYERASRAELTEAAAALMHGVAIAPAPIVDLLDGDEPLELELATSLLYPHCHYSYRQLREAVAAAGSARINEIIDLGTRLRGRHDELPRSFHAGSSLRFDILMDIGGFRDMHRHRRCTQLLQGFTDVHGYETPDAPGQPTLSEAGLDNAYTAAMDGAFAAYRSLHDSEEAEARQSAQYLLPLGTRCRAMFKMDFAEALYISELRAGAAGHYSYRRVAWAMYEAVQRTHPGLAKIFRIDDVAVPVDLLRR